MTNIRINFTESGVSLPDGSNCGVQGEHNAVQLVIALPVSMIDGCDYHAILFADNSGNIIPSDVIQTDVNADGAYRDGKTIYQPLTAAYTANKTAEIYVVGYKQDGDHITVVDRTKPVNLWFTPVPGFSKPTYPSGLETNVKGLMDEFDAIRSGKNEKLNDMILNIVAKASGIEAETYEDLLKEPFTSLPVGTRATVRKSSKYNRFGFWHGQQPQAEQVYNVVYFSPKLPPVSIFLPKNCGAEDFRTEVTFENGSEDRWTLQLEYVRWISDYTVKITHYKNPNAPYGHYYYLYEDKSVLIDGTKYELHEGWNHGYIDADTGLLTYEPCDTPEPLYDVKCTSLSYFIYPPQEFEDTYRVFAFVCRPDEPYMVTMHKGVYEKESEYSWKMAKETDETIGRSARITVKHDAEAWVFGQQTFPTPGSVKGDYFRGSASFDAVIQKFSITGILIQYDTITLYRDTEQPLPETDSEFYIAFANPDCFTPKKVDTATSETTGDETEPDPPLIEPIEEVPLNGPGASAPEEVGTGEQEDGADGE